MHPSHSSIVHSPDPQPDIDAHRMLRQVHSQESLYNHSTVNNNHMFTPVSHTPSEYYLEEKHTSSKLNGPPPSSFKPPAFSSFNNNPRERHQPFPSALPTSSSFRDSSNSYLPGTDAYAIPLASPTQTHMPSFDSRSSLDFATSGIVNGTHKAPYVDHHSRSNMLASQKLSSATPQSAQMNNFSGGYPSSMQISSQTPFGPHIASVANVPTSNTSSMIPNMNVSGSNPTSIQEDISTIFVVGFPDDMQVCWISLRQMFLLILFRNGNSRTCSHSRPVSKQQR